MKMVSRYKPKGWTGESVRHSLSSKGIKSKVDYSTHRQRKDALIGGGVGLLAGGLVGAGIGAGAGYIVGSKKKKIDHARDTYKVIDEKKFRSRVTKDTAYGRVADYGVQDNTMRLVRVGNNLLIEWHVGDDMDYAEIGIFTAGKDVIEVDGVFELPKEAIQLLKKNGYNTEEVE